MQKRIITIQDISCLGRCSITVALPVLSSAGIETTILPTAMLSTHTGGFTGFTCCDLEKEVMPIVNHWMSLDDVYFNGIYTGYLASDYQVDLIKEVFKLIKSKHNVLVMVDPAMADNGKMYPAFSDEFALKMKTLCMDADIIVPNLTEACKMIGKEYISGVASKEYIEEIMWELAKLGPKKIVLTSVILREGEIGSACLDLEKENSFIEYYFNKKIEGYFHGSGDIYSSSLLAGIMKDMSLIDSVKLASNFTYNCINRTKNEGTPVRYGVNFEEEIPGFIDMISKK